MSSVPCALRADDIKYIGTLLLFFIYLFDIVVSIIIASITVFSPLDNMNEILK